MKMARFVRARKCFDAVSAFGSGSSVSHRATMVTQSFSTQVGKIQQPTGVDPEVVHTEMLKRLTNLFEEETKRNLVVPPFKRALLYGDKSALRDHTGDYSFIQIYDAVKRLALEISNICGSGSQSRVALICPNNVTYLISQWASWFSGQIVVPLSPNHPQALLEYYIKDSDASLIIATPEFQNIAQPLVTKLDKKLLLVHHDLVKVEPKQPGSEEPSYLDPKRENLVQLNDTLVVEGCLNGEFYRDSKALIMYVSGTSGKPKGVVLSFANIDAQFKALSHAWQIKGNDSVLQALPLNHIHGTINTLNLSLSAGAKCVMLPRFDSSSVWSYLLNINMTSKERVNIFMGVPTMYGLLIKEYDNIFGKNDRMRDYVKTHCKNKIRLMVSGSSRLPATIYNRWYEISGHKLLERYGMTEMGMAISNPTIQDNSRVRKHGWVGMPLPGVTVKIVDKENNKELILEGEEGKGLWNPAPDATVGDITKEIITGNVYIKGPSVFSEYWQKPEETAAVFEDGWFNTGDIAEYNEGSIKILDKKSTDFIESSGIKLSALEIESAIREYKQINDVALFGLPDDTWGSKVIAVLTVKEPENFSIPKFLVWLEQKLPKEAVPKEVKLISEIPRDVLGKINKKELIEKLYSGEPRNQEKVVK